MTQESDQEKKPNITAVKTESSNNNEDESEDNKNFSRRQDDSDSNTDSASDADENDEADEDADESESSYDEHEDGENDENEENGSPNETKPQVKDEIDEPLSPPGEKCPICLNSLSLGQDIGTPNSCQGIHHFCLDCIEEWSANVNTCPVDRKEFTVVLVKRELNGPIIEKISVSNRSVVLTIDESGSDVAVDEDLTFCEICGRCDHEDRLLLCDGCDFGYHCECLDPPLHEIPIEEWYCPDCLSRLFGSENDDQTTFGQSVNRLRRSRRIGSGRVIARTRASEVVRNRIIARRTQSDNLTDVITHVATNLSVPVAPSTSRASTTRSTSRVRRRKSTKRRSSGKSTGKKRKTTRRRRKTSKRKSRKSVASTRALPAPVATRVRLSKQLGLQKKKCLGPHSLPLINKTAPGITISSQREVAGINSLSLMGQGLASWGAVPIFNDEDDEQVDYSSGASVDRSSGGLIATSRSRVGLTSNILSMKSSTASSVNTAAPETGDLLGSILAGQEILHAESSRVSITRDGTLKLNSKNNKSSSPNKRGCTGGETETKKTDGDSHSETSSSTSGNNSVPNKPNGGSSSSGSTGHSSSGEAANASTTSSISGDNGGKDSTAIVIPPTKVPSPRIQPDDFPIVKPTPKISSPGLIPLKKRKIDQQSDATNAATPLTQESPADSDIFSDVEPMTDDSSNANTQSVICNIKDEKPEVKPEVKSEEKTEGEITSDTGNSDDKKEDVIESKDVDSKDVKKEQTDDTTGVKAEPEAPNEACDTTSKSEKSPNDNETKPAVDKDSNSALHKETSSSSPKTKTTGESSRRNSTDDSSKVDREERKLKKCKHGKVHTKKEKDKKELPSSSSNHETSSSEHRSRDKRDDENRSKNNRDDASSDQWKNRSNDYKKRSYREFKEEPGTIRDKYSGVSSHSRDGNFSSSRSSNYSSSQHNRSESSSASSSDRRHNEFQSDSKDSRNKKSYASGNSERNSTSSHGLAGESGSSSHRDKGSPKRLHRSSRDESDFRQTSRDGKGDDDKNRRKYSSESSDKDRNRSRHETDSRSSHHQHYHHRSREKIDDTSRLSEGDIKKKRQSNEQSNSLAGSSRARQSVKSTNKSSDSMDISDDDKNSQSTPTQDEGDTRNSKSNIDKSSTGNFPSSSNYNNSSSSRTSASKIAKESIDGVRNWITTSSSKSRSRSSNDQSIHSSKSLKTESTKETSDLSAASTLFDQLKASVPKAKVEGNSANIQQLLQVVSMSGLLAKSSTSSSNGNSSSRHTASSSANAQVLEYSDNSDSDSDGLAPYSPGEDFDELMNRAKSDNLSSDSSSLTSSAKFQAAVDQILKSAQQQQQQKTAPSGLNLFKKPRLPNDSQGKSKQLYSGDSETLTSARELDKKEKYIRKLNRQERVVEEVKVVLKPFYRTKAIDKNQYKEIMRKAVPKICNSKSGEIIPVKIKSLVEKYVEQAKHQKKKSNRSSQQQS